jgi:hypothetical protein
MFASYYLGLLLDHPSASLTGRQKIATGEFLSYMPTPKDQSRFQQRAITAQGAPDAGRELNK